MPKDEDFVNKAEDVIKKLKESKNPQTGRPIPIVTTSKIRKLLAMSNDIYNEVRLLRGTELSPQIKERISYLRMRCIYEAGRDDSDSVREFMKKSEILDKLANIKTREDYIKFSRYMEALVAWRKYSCEKDG